MLKYAKVVNEQTKQCDVGTSNNIDLYKRIGMVEIDVEQSYNGDWYLVGYCPIESENEIIIKNIKLLEAEQTLRLVRNATLGEEFAINKLRDIETEIAVLRETIK